MTITLIYIEWNPINGFMFELLGIEGESGEKRSLLAVNACQSFAYLSILYFNICLFDKTEL